MTRTGWLLGVGALVCAAGLVAAAQGKTAAGGVFTEDQATKGKATYAGKCAACHGEDLSGGGFAPALSTDAFTGSWSTKTLGDLFDKIKSTMPADSPGTLSDDGTAELVAFILKTNGFHAGSDALPSQQAALAQITIAKP